MNDAREHQGQLSGRIRVLVADDNEFFRGVLSRLIAGCPDLELLGSVADGCEAVKAVRRWRPDLVVINLQMPRLNGLQTTALIRESFPDTRVIIVSADDSDSVGATCLAQGVDGFVPKRRLYQDLSLRLVELFPNRIGLQPA